MSDPDEHHMQGYTHTLQQGMQNGQVCIIHCGGAAHVNPVSIAIAVYLAVHALQPAALGFCLRLSSARLMQAALPVGLVLS